MRKLACGHWQSGHEINTCIQCLTERAESAEAANRELRATLEKLIARIAKLPKRFPTNLKWDEVEAAEKLLTAGTQGEP